LRSTSGIGSRPITIGLTAGAGSASASAAGSGLTKTCAPLWSSPVIGLSGDGSPAIVNGAVFVNVAATIYAYSV